MKKYFIIIGFVVFGGIFAGCNPVEYNLYCSGQNKDNCDLMGFSPIATPTPDIDTIQQNVDDWLDDYLSRGKLW